MCSSWNTQTKIQAPVLVQYLGEGWLLGLREASMIHTHKWRCHKIRGSFLFLFQPPSIGSGHNLRFPHSGFERSQRGNNQPWKRTVWGRTFPSLTPSVVGFQILVFIRNTLGCCSWSVTGKQTSASPGNLIEMENRRPHPRSTQSETKVGAQQPVLMIPPGDYCTGKFQNV